MAFPDRIERTVEIPEGARHTSYDGNTRGWASKLGELAGYLDAAA